MRRGNDGSGKPTLPKKTSRAAATTKPQTEPQASQPDRALLDLVLGSLDDDKAEDVVVIDLYGKSSIADFMVIASGRSSRQVITLADHLAERLKARGPQAPSVEGKSQGDWVLVDGGDIIVHLFRPEVRAFYALEKMWGAVMDGEGAGAAALA